MSSSEKKNGTFSSERERNIGNTGRNTKKTGFHEVENLGAAKLRIRSPTKRQ